MASCCDGRSASEFTLAALVQPLSAAAADILRSCPPGEWFSAADGPFTNFGHGKAELDGMLNVAPWILHDLRRTAPSLMGRAGVRLDVIERVLNHKIKGVAGVYQWHHWEEEKRAALERLATLVLDIVK
jgi:integrase